jgi:hypothetical protein
MPPALPGVAEEKAIDDVLGVREVAVDGGNDGDAFHGKTSLDADKQYKVQNGK